MPPSAMGSLTSSAPTRCSASSPMPSRRYASQASPNSANATDVANPESEPIDADDDEYEGLPSSFAAACRKADAAQRRKPVPVERPRRAVAESTLQAAEFLMREGDIERFCQWFERHTPQERAEILDHLERRRRARK